MFFDELEQGTIIAISGELVYVGYVGHDLPHVLMIPSSMFKGILVEDAHHGYWDDDTAAVPAVGSPVMMEINDHLGVSCVTGAIGSEEFEKATKYAGSLRLRVRSGSTVIWEGLRGRSGALLESSGSLPREFSDEHVLEAWYDDDVVDTPYDTSYAVPGYWRQLDHQEDWWLGVIRA